MEIRVILLGESWYSWFVLEEAVITHKVGTILLVKLLFLLFDVGVAVLADAGTLLGRGLVHELESTLGGHTSD